MKIKIAYDLDGVICPDLNIDYEICEKNVAELHAIRMKICPIFIPTGAFIIITGRPMEDKEPTEKWFNMHRIYPTAVYYNTTKSFATEDIIRHKHETLNRLKHSGIELYVESEPKQVFTIRQNTDINVIHFSEFVSRKLHE